MKAHGPVRKALAAIGLAAAMQGHCAHGMEQAADATAPARWSGGPNACPAGMAGSPLRLQQAIERALCSHPRTRQAWAVLQAHMEQLAISRAAYVPVIHATLDVAHASGSSDVKGVPQLSSDFKTSSRAQVVSLSWVLFDFGARGARLDSAAQLLAAAGASQEAAVQAVLMEAAQAYYDVLRAQGALAASQDTEKAAGDSYLAANARHRAGAGTLADKLQAMTSHTQAMLNCVKSARDVKNAEGMLATLIGLAPDAPLVLEPMGDATPELDFSGTVDTLMQEAKRRHPQMAAAQAEWRAADADVRAASAEGLPSLHLLGSASRNTPSSGFPMLDSSSRNRSVGVELRVPIFDGLSRSHQVRLAQAKADAKSADVDKMANDIALNVWKSYQALVAEAANLKLTEQLLAYARETAQVAQGRYKAGAGAFSELLNAQSALASARQQRVAALSNWRIARLQLAGSLGRLGLWAVQ